MSQYCAVNSQEWTTVECDVDWEITILPPGQIFKFFRGERESIKDQIKSMKSFDGQWESKDWLLVIVFLPQKVTIFTPDSIPESYYSLITRSAKKHFMLLPTQSKRGVIQRWKKSKRLQKRVKKTRRKTKKKRVLEFLESLNFKKYTLRRQPQLFRGLGYQPIKEFIAANYRKDLRYKAEKITNITDLLIFHAPSLKYSPYMNHEDQIQHLCKKVLPKFWKKKLHRQDRIKDFERAIEKTRNIIATNQPNPLDILSQYCTEVLDMPFSTCIYNYTDIDDLLQNSKNGLYLYKTYNSIIRMMYYVSYKETRILKDDAEFIDISKWLALKDKYLVNDEECTYFKIDPGTKFISIDGRQEKSTTNIMTATERKTNEYTKLYLIQKQYFKYDRIDVDLNSLPSITGTIRVNPLCMFQIFK